MPLASPTFSHVVLNVSFLKRSFDYICFLIKKEKNPQMFFIAYRKKAKFYSSFSTQHLA